MPSVAQPLPAPFTGPSLHEIERLPALGGAELVRARGHGAAPPPLLLAGARRIEPLHEAASTLVAGEWSASYVVPAEAAGLAAALEWPDGARGALPAPAPRRAPRLVLAPAPPGEPPRAALRRELAGAAAVAADAREETAARIAEQAADMRLVRDQAAGRV